MMQKKKRNGKGKKRKYKNYSRIVIKQNLSHFNNHNNNNGTYLALIHRCSKRFTM